MYFTMPADWLCCGYLRKSREDEDRERREGLTNIGHDEVVSRTLERHQRILENAASENDHTITQWYREVVSGETIKDRPEIKRLLADIAAGRWNCVYAVEASRLGRGGGSDQEKIVNAFRYTGTWLVTEEKSYDPDSKSDMKQLKNDLRNSEDELDSITARLMRGKTSSAKEGRWQSTGRTPYGWRAVRIKGLWQLEPDENHGSMLRIYDMLEIGYGCSMVADIYEKEGVATARGGIHWTAAAIRAIALNWANCGYVVYGKRATKRVFDPETFEVKKTKYINDKPIKVRGLHYGKGGIEEERFVRITEALIEKSRTHGTLELKNPLAGLLRCGKCGYALNCHMMSSGKSKAYFYQHKRPKAMTRDCTGCRGARKDAIIKAIISSLHDLCADIEIQISSSSDSDSYMQHIAAMKEEVKKTHTTRRRIMEAYEAGVYGVSELKERKAEIDKRIDDIEKSIAEAKPPEYTQETITSLHHCIDLLEDDTLSAQTKNDFLKTVIKRIDYYNDSPLFVPDNAFRLEIFLR